MSKFLDIPTRVKCRKDRSDHLKVYCAASLELAKANMEFKAVTERMKRCLKELRLLEGWGEIVDWPNPEEVKEAAYKVV